MNRNSKKKRFLTGAVFFLTAVLSFAQTGKVKIPENADFWSDYPAEDLADFLVSRMNSEELLSQILMFGWAGAEPSELLIRWVYERGLGSVKVFGWNTDNINLVAQSVSTLQKKSQERKFKIPLFVATDQEGGWIRHVKGETSETPGNMAIGAGGYPIDAYYSGYYISREIKALGINMNFAPTVDNYTNLRSSVIGPRSFGSDPDFVGQLGASFAAGSIDAGVIPTAKHFPGHGDTSLDSHGNLPQIDIDYQTLENRELVPFKFLIAEKIPAIMSGHLGFPKIIANGEPASLSKVFLTDILRNRLGYEGLIITDDMMMNGATMYAGSLSRAFRLAIEAGNDIVISSTTAHWNENLWTSNLALMDSSTAFRQTVEKAARRVILYKLNYFKSQNAAPLYPDPASLSEKIPDREGQKFFLSQACRSITAYKSGNCLPFNPAPNERILLAGQTQFPQFFEEAKKRYSNCAEFKFDYEMGPNQADWMSRNIETTARNFDTVIICVANERSAMIAQSLKNLGKKVVIMSVLSPVPVLDFTWADTILLGYSYSPYTFQALFGALNGEFKPQGELPLSQTP
ncbi:glycoside hydrolase family 3 protein [Treponema berlinense]|uniref:glycoside hydrolase family 3 protein n=1 Tax=Treponema berlinense TaxID=225004 RepID=UPI0026F358DF|nr:glycoside hydrolase family 3 protein [Treponema berlinense]